jgi:hypothetical protein
MVRILLAIVLTATAVAEPARIHVFVALADNASQGIIPVPAKIGDGNDPKGNLYWGCSEALPPVFKTSRDWKLVSTAVGPKASILERVVFAHRSGKYEVIADAYRGSAIMECTTDFFAALTSDAPVERSPLVAYIGHDGLMDFALPEIATAKRGPGREAIVLCCKSRDYFGTHLGAVNAKPVLLTTQLMYPGGFLLRAALDGWIAGETPAQVRQRAATAYARNQKISAKAAAGVFAKGEE